MPLAEVGCTPNWGSSYVKYVLLAEVGCAPNWGSSYVKYVPLAEVGCIPNWGSPHVILAGLRFREVNALRDDDSHLRRSRGMDVRS